MTNQIPAENTITPQEFHMANGATYGLIIGQLIADKLTLEKQNQTLQSRLNDTEEVALGLKQENAKLIKTLVAREDEIHSLEIKVAALIEAGPTADQIARQAKAIIDEGKIKEAAPEGYEDTETIAAFAAANYGEEKAAPVEAA